VPLARLALLLCVLIAFAIVTYSIAIAIPPLWLLVTFFLIFATIINVATYFLNLQAFVDVWSRGPSGARGVALTFDDGPHPVHTREVLRLLKEHGAKATFFVIGKKAEAHPDVIREIAADGHDIGIHTYSHDRLLNMRPESQIEEEIAKTAEIVEQITGKRPTLFRPPVGFTSPRITLVVKWLAVNVVGWSVRAFDGVGRIDPQIVLSRIVPRLRERAIVLLHDAFEIRDERPASLDALPALLTAVRERGLTLVPISAWERDFLREGRARRSVARRAVFQWSAQAYVAPLD
jgi:peptidoglycan-N-acetylglucosamine deacetylase